MPRLTSLLPALLAFLGVGLGIRSTRAASLSALDPTAKIFFKAATYDENLPAGDLSIVVAVAGSAEAGGETRTVFDALRSMTVKGRPLKLSTVVVGTLADIDRVLGQKPYAVFLVGAVPEALVAPWVERSRTQGVFTFTQDADLVGRGLGGGVREDGKKRSILINLSTATRAGRKFAGAFLGLCTVVR